MTDEIELVADEQGLAVIGSPQAVDVFLAEQELNSRRLDLGRLTKFAAHGGSAVNAASLIAANTGRWVQITDKSAQLMQTSRMMTGSADGLKRAVFTTDKGKITGLLEIVKTPTSILTNPALLSGVGGLMTQMAMQKAMDDIQDYLVVIDKKIDDVLRAQKDAALADMIAVGLMIDEAMTIRAEVGKVSDVTWSKVQGGGMAIARTQAYALRQLDALAEKLERESHVDDLAKTTTAAARTVQEWLAVLARCFQLHDGLAVLELERVLDATPDELDRHRIGLQKAARKRFESITATTTRLLRRMDEVAGFTSATVLMNPFNSRKVVNSINSTGAEIAQFHGVIGVAGDRQAIEAKRWLDAAGDVRDDTIGKGAEAIEVTVQFGSDTFTKARKGVGRFATDVSERLLRERDEKPIDS
ncbi:hypothetical protein [Protaetiibacter mangrovi]|uniref:Uncharacterized protein n=1 Tax=Protaetiibacter mangrovi TaxID=2970926 RepID=A0ABT1ZER8_9MICO|nr:hypothetical protein [Protaetiibacter mangrovi]MCS0499199.1 hypothetical protein [Protaetiibacter mangrovi]TPX04473.1 hypothetical protein FJ656_11690 [Schumannella luteola]